MVKISLPMGSIVMLVVFWIIIVMNSNGPPIFIIVISVSGFRLRLEKTIWLPSSGGIGKRLKIKSPRFIAAARKTTVINVITKLEEKNVMAVSLNVRSGRAFHSRRIPTQTRAKSRLDSGPAAAIIALSRLGCLKFAGLN